MPDLIHYLHSYVKGCYICQLSINEKPPTRQLQTKKPPTRQLQTRVNLNYRPLSRLSVDLKVMSRSNKGHKYILCIINEVTDYLIVVPIQQSRSEEIDDALIDNVISKYWVPDYIIMDQDIAVMSTLMNYLL